MFTGGSSMAIFSVPLSAGYLRPGRRGDDMRSSFGKDLVRRTSTWSSVGVHASHTTNRKMPVCSHKHGDNCGQYSLIVAYLSVTSEYWHNRPLFLVSSKHNTCPQRDEHPAISRLPKDNEYCPKLEQWHLYIHIFTCTRRY